MALVVVLVYVFGFYLPSQDVVRTGGGTWILAGSPSGLSVHVACANCGQQVKPNAELTLEIGVSVDSAQCTSGFFGTTCPGVTVQSISINLPYTAVSIAPGNLPYFVTEGTGYTWALTVQAPGTAGHSPASGLVTVQ